MVAALRAWVGAEANWALCGSAGISSRDTAVTFVGGNISFYDIKPRAPRLQDGAVPARRFAFQSFLVLFVHKRNVLAYLFFSAVISA